jgi:hypothetical protein
MGLTKEIDAELERRDPVKFRLASLTLCQGDFRIQPVRPFVSNSEALVMSLVKIIVITIIVILSILLFGRFFT